MACSPVDVSFTYIRVTFYVLAMNKQGAGWMPAINKSLTYQALNSKIYKIDNVTFFE